MLPRERMFAIVSAVAAAALPEGKSVRKLTFAGGEPTLCPWLPELIAHAKRSGLVTMVVTNASRCSSDYLEQLAPSLDWLTLSIDSLDSETNRAIGRHNGKGEPLSVDDYASVLATASDLGIRTKINTVVNRINWLEDMGGFLSDSGIARWKVLQIMPVEGQNDEHINDLLIDRSEFDAYVDRHYTRVAGAGIRIVPEPVTSIRGSYCMIDPRGRFFDSSTGAHHYSRPILEVGIKAAFEEVSFDRTLFDERGGSYDFAGEHGSVPTSTDVPNLSVTLVAR